MLVILGGRTEEQFNEDYKKFRGQCRRLCEEAMQADSTLRLVRGHYFDISWGEQAHWWCVKPDGTIVDPSAAQFPSNGHGDYVEFDGTCECANCGKEFSEKDSEASFDSNYAFCSGRCHMRFVGL